MYNKFLSVFHRQAGAWAFCICHAELSRDWCYIGVCFCLLPSTFFDTILLWRLIAFVPRYGVCRYWRNKRLSYTFAYCDLSFALLGDNDLTR